MDIFFFFIFVSFLWMQTLIKLNLSNNRIKDHGIEYLANALQHNNVDNFRLSLSFLLINFLLFSFQTLTVLDLRNNQIMWERTEHLLALLQNSKVLMIIWFTFLNWISSNWLKKLAELHVNGSQIECMIFELLIRVRSDEVIGIFLYFSFSIYYFKYRHSLLPISTIVTFQASGCINSLTS